MPGGVIRALSTTNDVNRIEAPVTWKAYLICAFASFGGIFFGYDSGYINGATSNPLFIHIVEGPGATALSSSHSSLIVSILSCGTFFGALIAGDVADMIGRKYTVVIGCGIYILGVVIQMITGPGHGLGVIVAGRLVAGLGVGFESAIVILYMSEIVSIDGIQWQTTWSLMCRAISVPRKCAVLSWPDTNSVSRSAFSSRPASSTHARTDPTPVPTVFPSPSNLPGA
jgi:hypothetical protein